MQNIIILVQGFCPLKIKITHCPGGFCLKLYKRYQKEEEYFPTANLEDLIDTCRRQSLVAGYCQGAIVIHIYNELVISYSPVTKLVLGPACSSLPDGP